MRHAMADRPYPRGPRRVPPDLRRSPRARRAGARPRDHGRPLHGRAADAPARPGRAAGPAEFRKIPNHRPPSDLVNREFARDRPNQLWVTDITEHPHPRGQGVLRGRARRLLPPGRRLVHRLIADRGPGHQRARAWRSRTARPNGVGDPQRSRHARRIQLVVATPRSMEVLMGRPAGWMTELTGRSPMRSPGAPTASARSGAGVLAEIAKGLLPRGSRAVVGVSQAVGGRWFRHGGGMPPFEPRPFSGRYLSFAEREEIALLQAQGHGVREIARRAGTLAVDDLAGAAAQRRDAWREARVPGVGRAVEGRAGRPSPEDREAGRQRAAARVRAGAARGQISQRPDGTGGRARHWARGRGGTSRVGRTGRGRRPGARSRSRTGSGSTSPMMSPCASARGDLPGALHPGPRRAQARAGRLPAHRPSAACAAGAVAKRAAGHTSPRRS